MNRNTFIKPKKKFEPNLVLEFVKENPGISLTPLTHKINTTCGLRVGIVEVHCSLAILKRDKKIEIRGEIGGHKKFYAI